MELIKKLSECAGHIGIAGGQYSDLDFENKKISKNKIIKMQVKKQVNYLVLLYCTFNN